MVSGNSLPAVLPNPSELKKQPGGLHCSLIYTRAPASLPLVELNIQVQTPNFGAVPGSVAYS